MPNLIPVVTVPGAGATGYKAVESGLTVQSPMVGGSFAMQTPDGDTYQVLGNPTGVITHVPIPGAQFVMTSGDATTAGWATDSGDVRFGHSMAFTEGTDVTTGFAYACPDGTPRGGNYR